MIGPMMLEKLGRAVQREISYIRKDLRVAYIEPTYRCNLKCQMCALWKTELHKASSELTVDEWRNVVDDLARLGVSRIILAGAEALVRTDDTLSILEHAKSKGINCSLITNGTLLTETTARSLIALGLDRISVSVDAPEELHGAIRGVSKTYERATAGLRRVLEARRAAEKRRPLVNIHTTIMASNVAVLEGTPALANEIGADSYSFQYVLDIPSKIVESTVFEGKRIASYRYTFEHGDLRLTRQLIPTLREQIDKIAGKYALGMDLKALQHIPDHCLTEGKFPVQKCYVVRDSITINPVGDVHPCSVLSELVIGNCRAESLHEIWNGARFEAFRKRLQCGLLPACAYCCYFNYNLTFPQAASALLGRSLS